jgi:hypothetical protein
MIKDVNSPVNTAHTGSKVGSLNPSRLERSVTQVDAVIVSRLDLATE